MKWLNKKTSYCTNSKMIYAYVTLASNATIGRARLMRRRQTVNRRPTRNVNIGRGVSQPDSGVLDKESIEIERNKTTAVIIFGRPAGIAAVTVETFHSFLEQRRNSRRSEHITPLLLDFHWLRVPGRIEFRKWVLTHTAVSMIGLPHWEHPSNGRHHFRSSNTATSIVSSSRRSTLGGRTSTGVKQSARVTLWPWTWRYVLRWALG